MKAVLAYQQVADLVHVDARRRNGGKGAQRVFDKRALAPQLNSGMLLQSGETTPNTPKPRLPR